MEIRGIFSTGYQKWEYKGEVKVSLQLCAMCYDVGKVKSHMEQYYIDVLEVRKYRTILCKGCLAYVLWVHVGNCLSEIEDMLEEQYMNL